MMDLGTDINREWNFINGDLQLVKDTDNLGQSIINRVGCYKPNFEVYYQEYGGGLLEYLGMPRSEDSLAFIKIELDSILEQEERINSFTSELSFADDGSVRVDLNVTVNDEEVDFNLIIDRDGVSIAD